MSNRRKIAAGNWKMNLNFEEGLNLARLVSHCTLQENQEVILAVPFPYIKPIVDMLLHVPHVDVAAQNCHHTTSGAYTGEVSANMLESISCPNVVIGHSERRAYFLENNELLAHKVNVALDHNLQVIFCCGESLETRKSGKEIQFVTQQLFESLFHLTEAQFKNIILAYEPIWAIGTGETASSQQAQDMHAAIRKFVAEKYGTKIANEMSILYGGSVKPSNAKELFAQPDVDGGLVGGASLVSEDFIEIIESL